MSSEPPPVSRVVRGYTTVRIYGQVIEVKVIEPPRSTWMTGAELKKVQEERHEKNVAAGLECRTGDPLCDIFP